jgi:hypothetical protein
LTPSWPPKWNQNPLKNRCQNRSENRSILASIFEWIFLNFWSQNGPKLARKWYQKRTQLRKTISLKIVLPLQRGHDF